MPDGASAKPPVVLYLMHSGGFVGRDEDWVDHFLEQGLAVLVLDQYSDRDLSLSKGLGNSHDGLWKEGRLLARLPERSGD